MPVINRTVGEKWLIFVSSIQRGKALQQRIKKETGRKAVFLSSENKADKRWKTLSTEERYDEDVLITTKVLDNGVNISDKGVRHIVIPFVIRPNLCRCSDEEEQLRANGFTFMSRCQQFRKLTL